MKQKLYTTAICCSLFFSSSAQHVFYVEVSDFQFSPLIFAVQAGDTVKWNWTGGSHTTTSTVLPPGAESWDAPITSTNTSFKYVPSVPGTYYYKSIPDASKGMTGKFYVFPVSVKSTEPKISFSMYPNPVSSELWIQFSKPEKQTTITISNLKGQVVLEKEFSGVTQTMLDVSSFANGIYFVIAEQDGSRYKQKLIVSH